MNQRQELRNLAIIAHVDHGKTTLVDAMLWQSGVFRDNEQVAERVMDSMDLEREKGITIMAKNTAIVYQGHQDQHRRHPGPRGFRRRGRAHAQHGGRRDAAGRRHRGPAAPDALRARQGARPRSAAHRRDQQDRPARPAHPGGAGRGLRSLHRPGRDRGAARLPGALHQRQGRHRADRPGEAQGRDLVPLFESIIASIPAPVYDPAAPLQFLVTNLQHSDYVGRIAVGKVVNGTLQKRTGTWRCSSRTGPAGRRP